MIVNPNPDVLVRDPVSSLAVEPGADVDPNDPYWGRLIADGDLVAASDDAAPARAPRAPAAAPQPKAITLDEGTN